MSILEFKDVYFINDNKTILNNISVTLEPSDFISIVGPSSSGKSTFLRLCSSLISPSSGNIFYKNLDVINLDPVEIRKTIGYCFQTPYLFGDTALENIKFAYDVRKLKYDENETLKLFNLFNLEKDILHKNVKKLSGGEKQRIALIRLLLFRPGILLLDEVTSALDVENTKIVENVILKYNNEGNTIIWVTHNLDQSKKYANKLITIEDGRISLLEVLR